MLENILKKLSEVSVRYKEIEDLLSKPAIIKDQDNFVKISKEYADLSPVVGVYQDFLNTQSAIEETALLTKDREVEVQALAEAELQTLKGRLVELEIELKKLLLPRDPDDSKDVNDDGKASSD